MAESQNAQHHHGAPETTPSLYLELPWQGKRQMFGDIAGFFLVTMLLVVIDSHILCERQNLPRILLSIAIDYAILVCYIFARNIAMTPGSTAVPQAHRDRSSQQNPKWKEAGRSIPADRRPMAPR